MNAGIKRWVFACLAMAAVAIYLIGAVVAETPLSVDGIDDVALNEVTETPAPTATPTPSPSPTPSPTPTPKPIGRGMKGDNVKLIQAKLRELGFFSGSADGDYGPMTETAVKNLQAYIYTTTREKYLASYTARMTPAPTPSPTPEPTEVPEDVAVAAPGQPTATPSPTPEPTPEPLPTPLPIPKEVLTGSVNFELIQLLQDKNLQVYRETLKLGAAGSDVIRLQMRLATLDYMLAGFDGQLGPATESSLKYFQKVNKLPETGVADEALQKLIFSPDAIKSDIPLRPYMLKVSVGKQRVYAYAWDGEAYTILARTMTCSSGTRATPTPLGTYNNTGPGARWHYFKKFFCWAQYAYYIDGDIMFHSVLYNKQDVKTLNGSSKTNLGYRASHGCIRLDVPDAKWIWDNCPFGTTVVVYN